MRYGATPDPADRGRRDEMRLREADRTNRSAADAYAEANIVGRHTWVGDGNISPAAQIGDAVLSAAGHWTQVRDDGLATFVPASDFDPGGFYLNRPGRWVVHLYVASDMAAAGSMRIALAQATPGDIFDGQGFLRNTVPRATGYGGAGALDQHLQWDGPVFDTELPNPINVVLRNVTASGQMAASVWRLQLSYLGASTLGAPVVAPTAAVPQDDNAVTPG